MANKLPGYSFFWDFDFSVAKLYGARPTDAAASADATERLWVILDPTLRVIATIPFRPNGSDAARWSFLARFCIRSAA